MAWMRVGLDVEAAGKQAEVQKEQESVVDWTLKRREGRRLTYSRMIAWGIGG